MIQAEVDFFDPVTNKTVDSGVTQPFPVYEADLPTALMDFLKEHGLSPTGVA